MLYGVDIYIYTGVARNMILAGKIMKIRSKNYWAVLIELIWFKFEPTVISNL